VPSVFARMARAQTVAMTVKAIRPWNFLCGADQALAPGRKP